jgi:hypothetical protein
LPKHLPKQRKMATVVAWSYFFHATGEEHDCQGSSYYSENPLFAFENTALILISTWLVAMLSRSLK